MGSVDWVPEDVWNLCSLSSVLLAGEPEFTLFLMTTITPDRAAERLAFLSSSTDDKGSPCTHVAPS